MNGRVISVFVGCSSESLKFAQKVKTVFERNSKISCEIWNEGTFEYNETFLEIISKAGLIYDFGLFIASKDDIVKVRDSNKYIPRDNVLFEYGLFLGTMGNARTYLLKEEGVSLPSDLLGYTTPTFNANFTETDWYNLIAKLLDSILEKIEQSEIQILPSTSLAIAYFESFLKPTAKYLYENQSVSLLKNTDLQYTNVSLKVVIPSALSDNLREKAKLFYDQNDFQIDEIRDKIRAFPIRFYVKKNKSEIVVIDMPTILNSIRPSIGLTIKESGLGHNNYRKLLERKEIENFKRALEYLVSQNDFAQELVKIVWEE